MIRTTATTAAPRREGLTVRATGMRLGLSPYSVRILVAASDLLGIALPGRSLRVEPASVEAYERAAKKARHPLNSPVAAQAK